MTEQLETLNPVKVTNPKGHFLVVLPHAGSKVPEEIEDNLLHNISNEKGYDKFSSEIYGELVDIGAIVLASDINRYAVDLNRARDNFDPREGVMRSFDYDGNKLLREEYSSRKKEKLLSAYYDPFHWKLEEVVNELKEQYDNIFILAGHTMMGVEKYSKPDLGSIRPDFCIGTLDDTLSDPEYIRIFEEILRQRAKQNGFSVDKNTPYKGQGPITEKYGKPDEGIHVIQLEINRSICDVKGLVVVRGIVTDAVRNVVNQVYDNK